MTAWDDATFDGAARATSREVAAATPRQRLRWLAAAQRLAAQTGALQAELARRQAAQLELWHQASGSRSQPPNRQHER